jgi:pimeloyl-ACP methyl ester carboxylesterase
MATIVHQGITLAYEDRGAGKPAFVFVHGWTCNHTFFAPQAAHFARRHRVVSVDLRGHGESDKPQGPYPIAAYADDLAYLIEQLGLGSVVAVGHSSGGLTVLQLAAAHPDRVAAIVMVDPAPFVFLPERRASLEAMVAAIDAGNQEPRRQFIVNRLFLPTSDRKLVEDVLAVMLAAPSHVAASAMGGPSRSTAPPWRHSARCLRSTWSPRHRRSIRRIAWRSGCRVSSTAGPSGRVTSISWRCLTK